VPTKSKLVYLPPAQHDFEEIVKYHITEAGTLRAENLRYNENGHKPSARFPADGPDTSRPDPRRKRIPKTGFDKNLCGGLQSDRRHRLYLRHCQWRDRLSPPFEVITVLG
jgi:plasmid stabilization system protein ParE